GSAGPGSRTLPVAARAAAIAATPTAVATAATAAATAAAVAATATAAATAAAAVLARPGLVDRQRPALVVRAVEGVDGALRPRVVIHSHEPEPARPAGLPVGNHLGPGHRAVFLEQGQKVVGRTIPHEVADVDILRHSKENLSVPGPPQRTAMRTRGR